MKDPLEQIQHFSSHCFRHTFATRCFEANVAMKTVQEDLATFVTGKGRKGKFR